MLNADIVRVTTSLMTITRVMEGARFLYLMSPKTLLLSLWHAKSISSTLFVFERLQLLVGQRMHVPGLGPGQLCS